VNRRGDRRHFRVTFFEPYSHRFGGSHQVMVLLCQGLRARGVEVCVLTPSAGPLTDRLTDQGIPWSLIRLPPALMIYGHRTHGWRAVRAAASLPITWLRVLRQLRGTTDVLHINNLRGVLLLAPGAKIARLPVVWHVHLADPSPLANRFAAALARAIVVPSRAAVDVLPGVPHKRITIVPNCSPPDAADLVKSQLRHPQLMVTASRITPEKGLDLLLQSLPLVLRHAPNAELLVFGAPQLGYEAFHCKVKHLVGTLNLASKVDFVGEVQKPYRRWLDAALYVQPSRSEVQPMAILEAMAIGLPVVATDVGGVADLVVHGKTGLLVPPEDPRLLAEAILKLMLEPDAAIQMGIEGKQRSAHFSLNKITGLMLDVYRASGARCPP